MKISKSYYILKDTMPDKWLQPKDHKKEQRLLYIIRLQSHTPSTCPECEHDLIYEEDGEIYCNHCGLVCASTIEYVAGIRIKYPFGLRLG